MRWLLYFSLLLGFLVTFISTPYLIKYLRKIDLVVKDVHKEDKPLIPVSGGLSVLGGVLGGLMWYIFIQTFYYESPENLLLLFSAITTILLISFIGFIDDLVIERSKDETSGLRQWQKPLLTLLAAVPLMVIQAGTSTMLIPFLGRIDIGLLYPLLFVPVGIIGASNMVNMLAGFNGSEAGMGIIYLGSLGLYAYAHERNSAAAIAGITVFALLAFYYYNKVPAKIFGGDSLTYLLGGVLVTVAVLGNIERAALIVSIPFFIEFFLKARGKMKKKSIGTIENGKIKSLYGNQIYSIPHILTRTGKYTEKQVAYFMIFVQIIFSSLIWVL
ncbi:MAG: glycosyltransferase 4 family protein [Nanoarchaeota archaeon]